MDLDDIQYCYGDKQVELATFEAQPVKQYVRGVCHSVANGPLKGETRPVSIFVLTGSALAVALEDVGYPSIQHKITLAYLREEEEWMDIDDEKSHWAIIRTLRSCGAAV
ncbi:hypothetical protein GPECTOR_3g2 [Gonium pectorale]|uniref:Uncharacterized protein n=1 Tax=Gonium pectorale TaxID=33097 RepID=A0A150GYW5_GONPE|nr:hypothetical protein GPECTOR_3g2 [Gonium pectorale]|eukprot:KXZ55039.1 hypothetical protein GPECTOR_3g2 [Gonium pectorale]